MAKYAEDITSAKTVAEGLQHSTDSKLLQMHEMEQAAAHLRDHASKYGEMLGTHKAQVDRQIGQMRDQIERFVQQVERRVGYDEAMCKEMRDKEEQTNKQLAALQASHDLLNSATQSGRRQIIQLRESKADVPLIRETEAVWNMQLQAVVHRVHAAGKELSELRSGLPAVLEKSVADAVKKNREELMGEIARLDKARTVVSSPDKNTSSGIPRLLSPTSAHKISRREPEQSEGSISKSPQVKLGVEIDLPREAPAHDEPGVNQSQNAEELPVPCEYYDGKLVMNDESNEKYFTLRSGELGRKMSDSPLSTGRKTFNVRMMLQSGAPTISPSPRSRAAAAVRAVSLSPTKCAAPEPLADRDDSRNSSMRKAETASPAANPDAEGLIKGLVESKYAGMQSSFNENLKQFEASMRSDKKDVDDRVSRFVSKLRRERNDLVRIFDIKHW